MKQKILPERAGFFNFFKKEYNLSQIIARGVHSMWLPQVALISESITT